jgi:hypothetical protein
MRTLTYALVTTVVLSACGGGGGSGPGAAAAATATAPAATNTSSAAATVPTTTGNNTSGTGQPVAAPTGGSASSASDPGTTGGTAGRTLRFAGYTWTIKDSGGSQFGPGPNLWSGDAQTVFVDSNGYLHLRVWQENGAWVCSEIYLNQTLGYGTYTFTLASDVANMDPNLVLGLFTYSYTSTDPHNRELDIEFSRWGVPASASNAAYSVQPSATAGNQLRWTEPTALQASQHRLVWVPQQASFSSALPGSSPYAAFSIAGSAVPASLDEGVHLNLWLYQGIPPANGQPMEVIVTAFAFTPQ